MDSERRDFRAIVERALEQVPERGSVGLGTGHAATAFIRALGERVRTGLNVRGVPTSRASAELARQLGVPLADLSEVEVIDVDVDGADEVDPKGNLIKGRGGALLREKIVASASRRLLILVGPEKLVPVLGAHGILPVEVTPFGLEFCTRRLRSLNCQPAPRMLDGQRFVTDNGNYILDCAISPLDYPAELEQEIRSVPGVVGTGLFLGMSPTVLIQRDDSVEVRHPADD